jgi:hypothetical protein
MKWSFKLSFAVAAFCVPLATPRSAGAHMVLKYPPSRIVENAQGDPQKNGPCTDGTPTNKRTKLKPGQKIMVQWMETVHHPGHFRISFAENGTDVFKDPKSPTDIIEPPTGAVLKDGLFPDHKLKAPLQYEVTLPNVTCKSCTMQVVQVMLEGNDVSMYYHCADLELSDDAAGGGDAGTTPVVDAGGGTGGTAGMGGASGTGGVSGTGGSGVNTGGSTATGGSTGSGGMSGSTGSTATGGSTSASGGSTGAGSGRTGGQTGTGSGGQATTPPSEGSTSGCTMSGDQGARQPLHFLGLLAISGLVVALRRRRG